MFTIRNLGGVALFLFGTTYLWLTPMFVKPGLSTRGLWSITQVGSLLTLLGFTVATWRLFKRASWWDEAAIGSAILGLAVLVPYWIAAHNRRIRSRIPAAIWATTTGMTESLALSATKPLSAIGRTASRLDHHRGRCTPPGWSAPRSIHQSHGYGQRCKQYAGHLSTLVVLYLVVRYGTVTEGFSRPVSYSTTSGWSPSSVSG